MKHVASLLSVICLTGSLAIAQPTTAPSMPVTKVLIVPFKQIGDTNSRGWVGQAIEEDLMSNVASLGTTEAVELNHPLASADKQDVLSAAKSVDAAVAVFGSYQTSGNELRVTGQVVSVDSGKMLANLQATGPTTDLFKMEDTLGAEVTGVLPQPPSNMPEVTYGQGQNAPPANPNEAQPYVQQPYAPNPYYDYGYPYYYGYGYPYYYGYGYPYIGWGWGPWGWGGGFYHGFGGHGFVGHGFVGGGGHFAGGGHGR